MNHRRRSVPLISMSLWLAAALIAAASSDQAKIPKDAQKLRAAANPDSHFVHVNKVLSAGTASRRNLQEEILQEPLNNNSEHIIKGENESNGNDLEAKEKDIAEITREKLDAVLSKREAMDNQRSQPLDHAMMQSAQDLVPRNQPDSNNNNNADGGGVMNVVSQQLGDQLSQQQQTSNNDNNNEGTATNNVVQPVVQPPLATPSNNELTQPGQMLRESASSAANKLQQLSEQNSMSVVKPPLPPQPQQTQGVQNSPRREKLRQELAGARGRSPPNTISAAKEMPVPIVDNEEEVQIQQQGKEVSSGLRGEDGQRGVVQAQQKEELTTLVKQETLSEQVPPPFIKVESAPEEIGDSQSGVVPQPQQEEEPSALVNNEVPGPEQAGKGQQESQSGVVQPQQEKEATPLIEELPAPELAQGEERPLPLHHQSYLNKARANDQLSSVKEAIPGKVAAVENAAPKPLPPQPQTPLQQQQPKHELPGVSSIKQLDNLPDAVKNTMMEMEKKDIEEGKERGFHYKELQEQKKREADLRRQKLTVVNNSNPGSFVRPPPQAFKIDDPAYAQKFAEYIARQKKGIIRKEKLRHPIKAIVGGGGGNGGSVQTKANAQIHQKSSAAANNKMPDLRPEAQPKKRVGQKILGKIPVVKRAFKRTHAFETMNDAALSFTRGLLMGVFRNSNQVLDSKRKTALLNWLDLLSISIPPEIGLHELIDTLKINIDVIAQSPNNLKEIIDKHPIPDSEYSVSCTKGSPGQGFFCGFWKLLHIASVGFAEQQGGLMLRELHPNIRVFSPKEAGSVLREYMGLFFNCDKCTKRFIAQYDECKFQRCNRLTDKTVDAPDESWFEFPLWLWEIHNDVSRSKAERAADFHEKASRKAEAKKWERYMGATYPHIDQCVSCWRDEGTWDVSAVYNHLEKEYWSFGVEVHSKMETLLNHKEASVDNVSKGLGAYLGLGLCVLLTYFVKKYKIRVSGRHKKDDGTLFPKASGDGRIKYRDS